MEARRPIHAPTPTYAEQSTEGQILITGIKVVTLHNDISTVTGDIQPICWIGTGKVMVPPGRRNPATP